MRGLARWLLVIGAGAVSLGGGAAGVAPAAAAPSASSQASVAQSGPVSNAPAAGTPELTVTGAKNQVIRQIVQCGSTMYAVGSFSEITQNGTTYQRSNIFSFSATKPYTISSWTPSVNGEVNSIALTSSCTHAYIGGQFGTVDGHPAVNIAYIRTSNNTIVRDWPDDASKLVETLLLTNGHLLVGGEFNSINGSKDAYYASLNPTTGRDDGYLNLHVSGHYTYKGVDPNVTEIYNQQLSPLGGHVLVEGDFTSVEGSARQQIFMLNLAGNHGNVSDWNSGDFSQPCVAKHPMYIQAAAWSPDASTVYLADTGDHVLDWNGSFPLTGLCDAAAAFPATRTGGLSPEWINYTGCDSLFSVASDGSAVYVAGHPRWSENANGCNDGGPGSIADLGLQGLSPSNGGTLLNGSGAAMYSMSRANADDMLITSGGLWIVSTDRYGASWCSGVSGHAGLCFLPY